MNWFGLFQPKEKSLKTLQQTDSVHLRILKIVNKMIEFVKYVNFNYIYRTEKWFFENKLKISFELFHLISKNLFQNFGKVLVPSILL
jgi:hypothetical protein